MNENTLKVMITGHRPSSLGGYDENNEINQKIIKKLDEVLTRLNKYAIEKHNSVPVAISGMALGVDQWWAKLAIAKGINCYAYVPFVGQHKKWPIDSQKEYFDLIASCKREVVVSPGEYEAWKLEKRNRAMVEDADICIAVWNGNETGGTANCVKYIRKKQKHFLLIDSESLTEKWESF